MKERPDSAILFLPHAVCQAARSPAGLCAACANGVVAAVLPVVGFIPVWLTILEGPPWGGSPLWMWCSLACLNSGAFVVGLYTLFLD